MNDTRLLQNGGCSESWMDRTSEQEQVRFGWTTSRIGSRTTFTHSAGWHGPRTVEADCQASIGDQWALVNGLMDEWMD